MSNPPTPLALPTPRDRRGSSSSSLHRPSMNLDASSDAGPHRFRRTPSSSSSVMRLDPEEIKEREAMILAYEAEEERLVNGFGRKLEELKNENTKNFNSMESESEALVNRLQRQLQTLQAQLASQSKSPQSSPQLLPHSGPAARRNSISTANSPNLPPSAALGNLMTGGDPLNPSSAQVLEALKTENEELRSRLSSTERSFIHVTRLNDTYREELISLRNRLSMDTTDLIAPSSPAVSATSFSINRRPSSSSLSRGSVPRSPSLSSATIPPRPKPTSNPSRTSTSESTRFPPTSGVELDSISSSNAVSASSSSSNIAGMNTQARSTRPASGSISSVLSLGPPATGGEGVEPGGGAGQRGPAEVERRLSFGQPHSAGGRVAERGSLRRAGSGLSTDAPR